MIQVKNFWILAVCIPEPRYLDLSSLARLGSGRLGDRSETHNKCSAGLIEGRRREATWDLYGAWPLMSRPVPVYSYLGICQV